MKNVIYVLLFILGSIAYQVDAAEPTISRYAGINSSGAIAGIGTVLDNSGTNNNASQIDEPPLLKPKPQFSPVRD